MVIFGSPDSNDLEHGNMSIARQQDLKADIPEGIRHKDRIGTHKMHVLKITTLGVGDWYFSFYFSMLPITDNIEMS